MKKLIDVIEGIFDDNDVSELTLLLNQIRDDKSINRVMKQLTDRFNKELGRSRNIDTKNRMKPQYGIWIYKFYWAMGDCFSNIITLFTPDKIYQVRSVQNKVMYNIGNRKTYHPTPDGDGIDRYWEVQDQSIIDDFINYIEEHK